MAGVPGIESWLVPMFQRPADICVCHGVSLDMWNGMEVRPDAHGQLLVSLLVKP
jgi:hypothetical protein